MWASSSKQFLKSHWALLCKLCARSELWTIEQTSAPANYAPEVDTAPDLRPSHLHSTKQLPNQLHQLTGNCASLHPALIYDAKPCSECRVLDNFPYGSLAWQCHWHFNEIYTNWSHAQNFIHVRLVMMMTVDDCDAHREWESCVMRSRMRGGIS